jgi:hypothetical protein
LTLAQAYARSPPVLLYELHAGRFESASNYF